jgi:hypothetical protein
MTRYFYGASHEEFSPDDLLRHAVAAERAGFDGRGPGRGRVAVDG